MRGIIIGAGMGGLSTAIAMQMRHINVKIFEAATNIAFERDAPKAARPTTLRQPSQKGRHA